MDFETNLLFGYSSIIATIIAITVSLIIIIHKLRLRWPITANCWFCNTNTKIWRSETDWWRCPSCQQYNGFSRDGDYNYDIPEQRDISLNGSKIYTASCRNDRAFDKSKNSLCKSCNRNEELKMYQIRLINPMRLSASEVRDFRQSLEEQHPLCPRCNLLIKNVLQKQSVWLTQYKMLFFKQRPIKFITSNAEKLEKFFRVVLTVLSSVIIWYPAIQALPIAGALLQLLTAIRSHSKSISHVFLILLWLGVCTLMPLCENQLLKSALLQNKWFTLEYITGYQVITFLSTILGLMNATFNRAVSTTPNISFKKLETSGTNINTSRNSSTDDFDEYVEESEIETYAERKSPTDITHLLNSPTSSEKSAPIKPTPIFPTFRPYDSQLSFTDFHNQPDNFDILLKKSSETHNSEKISLNDSLRTLCSLSLSARSSKTIPRSPKVFETRTYGTTSPDLFKKNVKISSKKFVLSPAKLKSVTQNSWVAGGYWQMGMDRTTLSRSSSQSSGFGSTGSNFGPSREPSVANDVDRCSVMSDTNLCCHQPQTNVTPVNTFWSATTSPYRVISPEAPVAPIYVRSSSNAAYTQSPQRVLCHNYYMKDPYLNGVPMMIQKNPREKVYVNHPTILTSAAWLPALLCGSLVFNMVIFCMVLLR